MKKHLYSMVSSRILRFLSPVSSLLSPRGFTLLFAALTGSLLLAVGIAIFNITIKEVLLASTVRESGVAIYTADTGTECALYWDYKYGGSGSAFATSSASVHPSSISCNGQTIVLTVVATAQAATTTFTLLMPPQPYCAVVSVAKSGTPSNTSIISRGYNNCTPGDPRRTERAFQVNY